MKDFAERLRQLSIGSNDSHMREVGLKAADHLESQAAEIERLQRIIDSRPAINAGLEEAYVKWTSSIYALDIMNATETKQ